MSNVKRVAEVTMLPAKLYSNIGDMVIIKDDKHLFYGAKNQGPFDCNSIGHHLYFTIDEDICEGDFVLFGKVIMRVDKKVDDNNFKDYRYEHLTFYLGDARKIVASTDKKYSTFGLPQPSFLFIQKYCGTNGAIKKVVLDYEMVNGAPQLKVAKDNTITIHPIRSQYNKEEVEELLYKAMELSMGVRQNQLNGYDMDRSGKEILQEWIDNNLF